MSKPTITIFGATGILGQPIISALTSEPFVSKISLPITVVTRDPSKTESSVKVIYIAGDANDSESLKSGVENADVIINVLNALPTLSDNLVNAMIKYSKNLKLYIPSQFGTELDKAPVNPIVFKVANSEKARANGFKTIDVITSLYAIPGSFLYETLGAVGLYPGSNKAVIRGDPDYKFDITFIPDIAKSVAAIVTAPDYSALPDKIRISSDKVSQEQVLSRYEKTHDVKLERSYISKEDAAKDAENKYVPFNADTFLEFLQFSLSQGVDKGLSFSENENELVNPGQSLWKWSKFEL